MSRYMLYIALSQVDDSLLDMREGERQRDWLSKKCQLSCMSSPLVILRHKLFIAELLMDRLLQIWWLGLLWKQQFSKSWTWVAEAGIGTLWCMHYVLPLTIQRELWNTSTL